MQMNILKELQRSQQELQRSQQEMQRSQLEMQRRQQDIDFKLDTLAKMQPAGASSDASTLEPSEP